jgi:hypothetical protein
MVRGDPMNRATGPVCPVRGLRPCVAWEPEFRYGRVKTLEGTNLVLWAKLQSTRSMSFVFD